MGRKSYIFGFEYLIFCILHSIRILICENMALFRSVAQTAFRQQVAAFSPSCSSVQSRRNVSDLKSVLAEKIPEKQEEVKAFRKQHGNTKVGEITVDMVRNNFSTFILHNRDLLLLIPKKLR